MTLSTSVSAVLRAGLIVCALAGLAACGHDKPLPPCPQVRVDSTTAQLTKFRPGSRDDLDNVEYQVRVLGYKGECDFQDEGVEVTMDIAMEVASGPAAKPGKTPIYYFVALPQFFPGTEGKKIMVVNHDLKPGVGRRKRIDQHDVRVFIPMKKDEPAAAYEVYIGLQLTPDQLEYNREIQHSRE
jgi:hypothetical protein